MTNPTKDTFNLSKKIKIYLPEDNLNYILVEDVKEFIRRLKEEITKGCMGTSANCYLIKKEIDKLAGEELK